jgi:hypothetical protein
MKQMITAVMVAVMFTTSLLLSTACTQEDNAKPGDSMEVNPYMGAPVTLAKAPNGAIANKKILYGVTRSHGSSRRSSGPS